MLVLETLFDTKNMVSGSTGSFAHFCNIGLHRGRVLQMCQARGSLASELDRSMN